MAILALPPMGLGALLPEIDVPTDARSIVNAHYRLDKAPELPEGSPVLGVVGGVAEWIFLRGDVISVTVSAAERLLDRDAEDIAKTIWCDVSQALELNGAAMGPARIVKEKRATFAQVPACLPLRAKTRTDTANLFLAGDWTDTGLPATIEGAIRSGQAAARATLQQG